MVNTAISKYVRTLNQINHTMCDKYTFFLLVINIKITNYIINNMPGGLINVVSYVSTDLYLTGAPQITFYKMVYRRYTNFAMESVYLDFVDDIKFGHESELIPPRIGDLIHKSYLHVSIPNISITKSDVGIDTCALQYAYINKKILSNYEKIKSVYMRVMTEIYRIVHKAVNASNVSYAGLVRDVYNYTNNPEIQENLTEYDTLLSETRKELKIVKDQREYILDNSQSNLWHIITHVNISKILAYAEHNIDLEKFERNSDEYLKEIQRIMKISIFKDIDRGFSFCKDVQNFFFTEYLNFTKTVANDKLQNIKCAWVKNLGHSLIEYVDVYIGGFKIDSHLGIWINLWYQLTYKYPQIDIYNQMIGNVEKLTNFDNQEKPTYDMYIPLTFWFNKFNGLSFPLVAMQYSDIRFMIKLRKFEEVFYIEKIYNASLNGSNVVLTADMIDFIMYRSENKDDNTLTNIEEIRDICISDIWNDKGKQLIGHILMDYIYLESHERRRFAQSGHEYLIERIQTNNFNNIDQTDFDIRLDFTNPSKEIMWVFNKDCVTHNPYGYTECKWYDHSLRFCNNKHIDIEYGNNYGKDNPIRNAKLTFNNYVRIQSQSGSYFDKLQPLMFHHVTPSDGINIYSFSIDPLQHQPTGACNFTRLDDVRLFTNIDDMYYRYTDAQIYPHDLNINFKININDPETLIKQIDIDYVKRIIREHKLVCHNTSIYNQMLDSITLRGELISDTIKRFEDAKATMHVYEQLCSGNKLNICLDVYRRLLLKTTAKCHVFSLTMNILRLIGGYGGLAYN
jgi:hypothetical protein